MRYFVTTPDGERGPYEEHNVKEWLQAGTMPKDAPVRAEGETSGRPASQVFPETAGGGAFGMAAGAFGAAPHVNPYAPPVDVGAVFGGVSDEMQISAERGTRWLARFIDSLLSFAVAIPVMGLLFASDVLSKRDMAGPVLILAVVASSLPIAIYQWSLMSRTGQTLGKKWMKIKVVKVDGSPVDFVSGVLLREWVTSGISMIPYIGSIINLVGILMIFGDERRCLHDRIAGTKVIAVLQQV